MTTTTTTTTTTTDNDNVLVPVLLPWTVEVDVTETGEAEDMITVEVKVMAATREEAHKLADAIASTRYGDNYFGVIWVARGRD